MMTFSNLSVISELGIDINTGRIIWEEKGFK